MAKKKWWADLPKVEDKKYSRVPIGVKPMVNNQVTEPRGLGAVEFTGAGEDGVVQTDKPTELVQTPEGPRTIHEGEAKVKNEDGSTTIVPQDKLAELEKEHNIPGYEGGEEDVEIEKTVAGINEDNQSSNFVSAPPPAPPPPPQDGQVDMSAAFESTRAPVAEGDTVSAAPIQGLDFSGSLGHLGGPSQTFPTQDTSDTRTVYGGDASTVESNTTSDTDTTVTTPSLGKVGEEPSEDQVGIDALRDYVEGGSEQEQAIANNVMNRLNASATVAQKQNAMKIASNPNMSQGAKNAALLQMNRDISVQRSKLAGDIANTAATRAFEATKALGTLESNLADRVLKERQVDYEQNWKVIDSMSESDPVAAAEYAQEVFPGVEYNIEAIKEGVASGKFTESNVAIEGYLDDFVVSDIENPATLNEMVDWAISSGHAANLGIDTSTPEGREKVSKMITRRMRNNDPMYQTLNNISEESLNNLFGDDYVVSPELQAEIDAWDSLSPSVKEKYNNDPLEYERQLILDDKRSKFSSTLTGVISIDPVTGELTIDPTKATPSSPIGTPTGGVQTEADKAFSSRFGVQIEGIESLSKGDTFMSNGVEYQFRGDNNQPKPTGTVTSESGVVIPDADSKSVGDSFASHGKIYKYNGKGVEPSEIELTQEEIAADPFGGNAQLIMNEGKTGSTELYSHVLEAQASAIVADPKKYKDKLTDPESELYQAVLKDPNTVQTSEVNWQTSVSSSTGNRYLVGIGRNPNTMNYKGRIVQVQPIDIIDEDHWDYVFTDVLTGETMRTTSSAKKNSYVRTRTAKMNEWIDGINSDHAKK